MSRSHSSLVLRLGPALLILVAAATTSSTILANSTTTTTLANKTLVSLTAYPNARCLDGSPGSFYLRPAVTSSGASSRRFYIYQEGGGFCTDLADCYKRSNTSLGSSRDAFWPTTLDLDKQAPLMGFSADAAANPLLSTFNLVYMPYCDGAYFSGTNRSVTRVNGKRLFFMGSFILEAVVSELRRNYGLADASDVVLGGCSAGGIATFAHIDWFARLISRHSASARVVGFPLSGYYMDVDYFTRQKRFPYEQSNVSSLLNQDCVAAAGKGLEHKCLVADFSAPFIRQPLFLWQSRYDADQLESSFETPCTNLTCAKPYATNMTRSIVNNLWRRASMTETGNVNGGLVDSCHHHCSYSPDRGTDVGSVAVAGLSPLQAFAKWYRANIDGGADARGGSVRLIQPAGDTFPCIECCDSQGETKIE